MSARVFKPHAVFSIDLFDARHIKPAAKPRGSKDARCPRLEYLKVRLRGGARVKIKSVEKNSTKLFIFGCKIFPPPAYAGGGGSGGFSRKFLFTLVHARIIRRPRRVWTTAHFNAVIQLCGLYHTLTKRLAIVASGRDAGKENQTHENKHFLVV